MTQPSALRLLTALLIVGVTGLLGSSAYALTASNTVPGSNAGDGTSTVSGYTITGVGYGLNAGTPSNLDSVAFSISPATSTTVRARLAGTWYSCTRAGSVVTCPTTSPQATVSGVSTLQIVAV